MLAVQTACLHRSLNTIDIDNASVRYVSSTDCVPTQVSQHYSHPPYGVWNSTYIICCMFPRTDIVAAVQPIFVNFWMMLHTYPECVIPLLGEVPLRAHKIQNFGPLKSHLTADILKTISYVIICQSAQRCYLIMCITSMGSTSSSSGAVVPHRQ